ncbi:cobalt-zinc-cadmium resistance protein CzcA [Polymorphobacter multimanifer]|uniref:Cobalt-zinc-cadmium resistance protein CzcA n=1 Tax=Polymorphobacter multimanifer TaxID=1070431 RepID=A0A841L3I5_9SPHN|nr:CusA/CzcA family heavy metal efflux RND transporter [Polymorphobacter multimanifer]MBB6227227.1 cobalt-zinc-cadmium resistance protein CzcA [Polymorphobacter multimanifer]
MLQKLVDTALARRWLTAALALVVLVAGVWSFLTLPIDAFPEIAPTQVKLILKAPGMTPEEVEARVITPIEQQLLGMPDQQVMRSVAKYALADITISFSDSADIYWARAQVAERFAAVIGELPPGVSGGLAPISTPLSDMFMFTLDGPQSLAERRRVLDYLVRPALRTVTGVADVNVLGGRVETFEVAPDMAALTAAGIDLEMLRTALEAGNRNDGPGRAAAGESTLIVRAVGAVQTLDDLGATVIRVTPAGPVRVRDVAALRTGSLARYGAVTANGRGETVQAVVIGLRGSNADEVVTGVKARLAELAPTLPAGMKIGVFYDRSELIDHAVSTVEKALLEAAVLVVILLLLFLGDWRAALVVTSALPMAALITFILMRMFGLSANLMSLGGLAIAIGLLVDGAVVVVENIVERLAAPADTPRRQRVAEATGDVIQPVASGILIIILVFLPLLALQGLEGKLFAPVAVTIVLALAASLLLALTLIPVLAELALKDGDHGEPWLMRKLNPGYARLLGWARSRLAVVAGIAAAALLVAGFAYTQVGKIFLPTLDEGTVLVQLAKHPSIGLDHGIASDTAVQKTVLAAVPEVSGAIARLGTDELGLDPMSLNETDVFFTLKPRAEWQVADKAALTEKLRTALARHPGIEPSFTQPIEMRVSEMLTGARGDLAVKIFGPDLGELSRLASQVAARLRTTAGATEVITVADDSVDYLQLTVDREAAGRAGLTVTAVQDTLRAQLEGLPAGTVTQGLRRVPVMINTGGSALAEGAAALADTPLVGADGQLVRAGDVATVARVEGPVKLEHENGSRFALVQAFVSGRDIVGYVDEAQARIAAEVPMPPGYRIVWGGQFENQQRAAERLSLVLPVALALIFALLVLTFGALRPAVLILLMIPFALVGGILALWASGEYLSVPASVGFIALLGIAVLNGLVMVSHIRQLRGAGLPLDQAVDQGARRRLRPVLMTASIAAFGLVPLLFATGPGSEIQRPLAIVVIGGLVSATLLTLVLLPLLYARFGEGRAA